MVDPLAYMFAGIKIESQPPSRFEANGDWAVRFQSAPYVRFGTVLAGSCWLSVRGSDKPVPLERGDAYLLTRGDSYCLYTDSSIEPSDGSALFRSAVGDVVRHGPERGEATVVVSGRFTLTELTSRVLLETLPPFVRIASVSPGDAALLQACIQILTLETLDARFGSHLMRHHVAQIMLVQGLRQHVEAQGTGANGWLRALVDPKIGSTMQKLHADPARAWTVDELAKDSCMSRSMFALRFKTLAGVPPLEYLLRLRIRLAEHQLASKSRTVAEIAFELGYQSASAFSTSFRRVTSMSPKDYRSALLSGRFAFNAGEALIQ